MQIKNVRFIIAAITTFSAYAVYVSRVNLSIAIIAMVDDGHGQHAATLAMSNQAAVVNNKTLPDLVVSVAPITGAINRTLSSNETTTTTLDANKKANNQTEDKLHRAPLTSIFPASRGSVGQPLISQEKFHWDQTEQGHILGAFFYGYILFQIPGARMAESVGAKWIIMAANAGSALISLLFPLSTQMNSIHLLMVLRFVMGLCQSAFFPAAYVLFCRWLPEKERSVLLPIMFIGSNVGSISTYIMSSYLIRSAHGWPSVFYVSGFVCTLVTLFWCIFGSNGPDDNRFITQEESRFIKGNVNNQSSETNSLNEQLALDLATKQRSDNNKTSRLTVIPEDSSNGLLARAKLTTGNKLILKKSASCCGEFVPPIELSSSKQNNEARLSRYNALIGSSEAKNVSKDIANLNQLNDMQQSNGTPNSNTNNSADEKKQLELSWLKLLKSVPVWVLILSMYGNEWSNVVICYEMPTYLNSALNIPIEQNGVINSFFQLSYTLASPVMSLLGAYMLDKHVFRMRKIHVRKLFQSLATFGQLACYVSVPICGANRGLIILFMFVAIVFKTCSNAGDIMVPGDLSPEYAGTIFAFANSIGNTAGFFVPLLAAAFVQDAYEREQWAPFWLTTATIMGLSGLIFLFLGETRRQDFSPDKKTNEQIADEQGRVAA